MVRIKNLMDSHNLINIQKWFNNSINLYIELEKESKTDTK